MSHVLLLLQPLLLEACTSTNCQICGKVRCPPLAGREDHMVALLSLPTLKTSIGLRSFKTFDVRVAASISKARSPLRSQSPSYFSALDLDFQTTPVPHMPTSGWTLIFVSHVSPMLSRIRSRYRIRSLPSPFRLISPCALRERVIGRLRAGRTTSKKSSILTFGIVIRFAFHFAHTPKYRLENLYMEHS